MRRMLGRLVAAGTVTAVLVLAPAMASAGTGPGTAREFGRHVVTCAQTMGFSGEHNPGMHQGFAGWTAAHTC